MPIVSLIAAPGGLERHVAETVRSAFGGTPLRWLSPREAAEFAVPGRPDSLQHVRGEMGMLGVDVNLVPEAGRRKRVLLADMDSTMIGQECIDELADLAGFGPEVALITARAMNGEVDFEGALEARVALLQGLEEGATQRVLTERITYAPGGRTLVATMRARGAWTALVSGGFTAFTGPVAAHLGFDEHRANVLEAAGGRLTGRARRPYLGRAAKVEALVAIAAARGARAGGRAGGGRRGQRSGHDRRRGAGGGDTCQAGGRRRRALPDRARGPLTALLYLQGYAREEFATA